MNGVVIQHIALNVADAGELEAWLAGQMTPAQPYLLAHADDGVIWGRRQEDGTLLLSGDLFPEVAVALRWATLQQARVFGPGGELLVWRTPEGFTARQLDDAGAPPEAYLEEAYLLWHQGSPQRPQPQANGFALLEEGRRGLRHAPPVIPQGRRPRLRVRHYLDYDCQDQAYVALSRLVDLCP